MTVTTSTSKIAKRRDVLDSLISMAKKNLAAQQLSLVTTFIEQYFSNVPLEDLLSRPIKDLYASVLSHWHLIYKRKSNECKIQVFNPTEKAQGWTSKHTIIEIIQLDMPFLVDSIRMEVNRLGYALHLVIHIGGMQVRRNAESEITALFPFDTRTESVLVEAPIYIEIDKETNPAKLKEIQTNLLRILKDVKVAVKDWHLMQQRVAEAITEVSQHSLPLHSADVAEAKAFLHWLVNDHFTFLGYREYRVVTESKKQALKLVHKSGLGVLRDEKGSKVIRQFSELPEEARRRAMSDEILIFSKTNTKSTVHRPAYTDYIGVKIFDENGNIVGERRFIGLFTSDAYNDNPVDIPYFRRKVDLILEKSGVLHHGHAAKSLLNILETLPRDDLFQGSVEELLEMALGIWHLQERRRVRLFMRRDSYGRYVSCLVYLPRENFTTDLLNQIQEVLCQAYHGSDVSYSTYFPESVLARIHFVIRTNPAAPIKVTVKAIESQLEEICRSWKDALRAELLLQFGEERGNHLIARYINAFNAGYREVFDAKTAVYDIHNIEQLTHDTDISMSFYRPDSIRGDVLQFKLYRYDFTIPLSDAIPLLEELGLRVIGEQPYEIIVDHRSVWVSDFQLEYPQAQLLDIDHVKANFKEAFLKAWLGLAENDSFNYLVLKAHLNWREISVLRAISKYLRQTGFPFSQHYMQMAFINNPVLAELVFNYFKTRFSLSLSNRDRSVELEKQKKVITTELELVNSLDEDRIINRFVQIIEAMFRTNYFQVDKHGHEKDHLSFKFDPTKVPDLPLPLPKYEIFVYSPRLEGVHLRSSDVARGGIRHSDRPEDFRTEILGLVKAQQVKNAVIVPSGAKGGFICKLLPTNTTREMVLEEVIYCYQNFIRGLLDVVDNLHEGKVVKPKLTVCHDGDDPYLVVAADKGTASFSDIANSVAAEYDFWLGDAFASGGSAGYDHKKIGITARGAWECVRAHFQELGIDPNKQRFTAIGIGDMSGDVFGNGLLMSEHCQLVAAFNHIHIFIDPTPDPKISYQERLRLYDVPRSSWMDYNPKLISSGGGIYSRSAKAIKLSPEVKRLLNLHKETVVPTELIHAILKAKVDLLWNGGIGTYAKAASETNDQVGDRANDTLRVNGNEIQAKIVAEGGNLGFTQLARIEYELSGGRIFTDFIDNSGGVNCSDREVNIKILLREPLVKKTISIKQRNQLLYSMTDDVANLVLKNNYRTPRSINFAHRYSLEYLDLYRQYLDCHASAGRIPRDLEFLPDDKTLYERKSNGIGLTRPELAVLNSYSKIILKQRIIDSSLPEDSHLREYLEVAFPTRLNHTFKAAMDHHQLRREIIATQLSNEIVSYMGITFVYQMSDETGEIAENVIRAYVAARKIFKMPNYWEDISSLDFLVTVDTQMELSLEISRLIRRATRWFLRNRRGRFDIGTNVDQFAEHAHKLDKILPKLLVGEELEYYEKFVKKLTSQQVPLAMAEKFAAARAKFSTLNITEAAMSRKSSATEVAKIYLKLMEKLDLIWFREQINAYQLTNHWAILARAAFKGDLDSVERALTISVLKLRTKSKSVDAHIDQWIDKRRHMVARWQQILSDLRNATTKEFSMLSVAMRELTDLAHSNLDDHLSEV